MIVQRILGIPKNNDSRYFSFYKFSSIYKIRASKVGYMTQAKWHQVDQLWGLVGGLHYHLHNDIINLNNLSFRKNGRRDDWWEEGTGGTEGRGEKK